MSRELKRVPLDFDWPIEKVWRGFVNPHYRPCPEEGRTCWSGYSAAGLWLDSVARLIALIAGDAASPNRRGIYPHPYLQEWPQAPIRNSKLLPLTAEFSQLADALAGKHIDSMHGCETSWAIADAIKKAAAVPERWGICPVCDGHANDPATREAYEVWKGEEPPVGPGFQLWENCSEGSPVSPVFETLDELCAWCANNATTFGSARASAAEWRQMLDEGFVHHTEGNVTFC